MSDTTALRSLLAAASPTPWRYAEPPYYIVDRDGEHVHSDHEGLGANYANDATRDLIVAAVNSLPALLDRLDALEAAARAVLDHAETDDNFEGEFIDWLVPDEQIAALRAALRADQPLGQREDVECPSCGAKFDPADFTKYRREPVGEALDVAWREAESALPEGVDERSLSVWFDHRKPSGWWAAASHKFDPTRPIPLIVKGFATPADALRNLAAALRAAANPEREDGK